MMCNTTVGVITLVNSLSHSLEHQRMARDVNAKTLAPVSVSNNTSALSYNATRGGSPPFSVSSVKLLLLCSGLGCSLYTLF